MIIPRVHKVPRSGFSLMEVLVVMAILLIVAGIGGVIYMNYTETTKEDRAKIEVDALERAVNAHKLRKGKFPDSLMELAQPTDGSRPTLEMKALKDPWDRSYVYQPETLSPTGRPRIYSTGESGSAEIANWYQGQ